MAIQINEGLQGLGDFIAYKSTLWGYFISFQEMVQSRESIPKEIVEIYEKTICFMVDKDQCHIKMIEPRIVWIMPMGMRWMKIHLMHILNTC